MPSCYLLAVCKDSTLDAANNNFTLFQLVEEVQVSKVPITLPLVIHAHWGFAAEELGSGYELRIVLTSVPDKQVASDPVPFRSLTPRLRLKLHGFPLGVPSVGDWHLTVEYRRQGDNEWTRPGIVWPLSVQLQAVQPKTVMTNE